MTLPENLQTGTLPTVPSRGLKHMVSTPPTTRYQSGLIVLLPPPNYPGITPFLPDAVKRPVSPVAAGLSVDRQRKMILYAFGFTRNNAG